MTRLLKAGLGSDLSSVRLLLSGAEPIDAPSMAAFAAVASACGLDPRTLTPAYGLAESTLTVTQSRWGAGIRVDRVDPDALETRGVAVPASGDARCRQLVRLGRPIPTTEVRVVDPVTGERVGPRAVGRIEVRGPSVVGRYWGEPPPPVGAWLGTGDLGYLTGTEPDFGLDGTPGPGRAGELVVCGREKDVLFAAGRNVFPQDVEAAAAEVAGVRPGGVIAFGVPHDGGDRLVLAVESRAEDPDAVRTAVAAAVVAEVGLAPADVVMVPPGRLPKTTSGKLRRAEARHRYLAGELNAPTAAPTHVLEESR
jgi:fatty-acyl-CoA synthase